MIFRNELERISTAICKPIPLRTQASERRYLSRDLVRDARFMICSFVRTWLPKKRAGSEGLPQDPRPRRKSSKKSRRPSTPSSQTTRPLSFLIYKNTTSYSIGSINTLYRFQLPRTSIKSILFRSQSTNRTKIHYIGRNF